MENTLDECKRLARLGSVPKSGHCEDLPWLGENNAMAIAMTSRQRLWPGVEWVAEGTDRTLGRSVRVDMPWQSTCEDQVLSK